jgi:E3 ubiquitin-protein ligase synoviolin
MMVMFAFEFAVLSISSTSTAARYAISLYEAAMIKQQTEQKVEERRAEIRRERDRSRQSQEPESSVNSNTDSHLPSGLDNTDEIEIDESEIDVVGWQNKGQWVFALELTTGKSTRCYHPRKDIQLTLI